MDDLKEVIEDLSIKKKRHNFSLYFIPLIIIVTFSFFFLLKPTIKLIGKKEIEISYNETYQDSGVEAKFLGKDISKYVKQKGKVENGKVGEYTLSYDLRCFIFHTKKERKISIKDYESPEITLKGETTKNLCPNETYEEEGYLAYDEYDGNITDKVTRKESINEIIYEVADSSNNKRVAKRNISYQDTEKPSLTLKGLTKMYIYTGSAYKENGYIATDNCEGDITNKVTVKGNINTNKIGKYYIDYQVKDESGNETTIKREVNVIEHFKDSNSSDKKGVIYLTFDDGPSNITSKVLDILKEEEVKTTFFVTNNGSDNLIKRIVNEGHTIALHTASHNYSQVYSSIEAYFEDLNIVHDRVLRLTGIDSKYIRFPGGSSNTVSKNYSKGIMTSLSYEVLNQGYRYFDWNVSSGDAGAAKTKDMYTIMLPEIYLKIA